MPTLGFYKANFESLTSRLESFLSTRELDDKQKQELKEIERAVGGMKKGAEEEIRLNIKNAELYAKNFIRNIKAGRISQYETKRMDESAKMINATYLALNENYPKTESTLKRVKNKHNMR